MAQVYKMARKNGDNGTGARNCNANAHSVRVLWCWNPFHALLLLFLLCCGKRSRKNELIVFSVESFCCIGRPLSWFAPWFFLDRFLDRFLNRFLLHFFIVLSPLFFFFFFFFETVSCVIVLFTLAFKHGRRSMPCCSSRSGEEREQWRNGSWLRCIARGWRGLEK